MFYLIDLKRRKVLLERRTRDEIESWVMDSTAMPTIKAALESLNAIIAQEIQ